MKNIKELKELIDDLNQRKSDLENQVKSVCQDKTLSLDERWELFVVSDFGIHKNWYEDFEGIDNNDYNRYEFINLIDWVKFRLENCGFYDLEECLKDSEFNIEQYEVELVKLNKIREEILQKWIKSYVIDW